MFVVTSGDPTSGASDFRLETVSAETGQAGRQSCWARAFRCPLAFGHPPPRLRPQDSGRAEQDRIGETGLPNESLRAGLPGQLRSVDAEGHAFRGDDYRVPLGRDAHVAVSAGVGDLHEGT